MEKENMMASRRGVLAGASALAVAFSAGAGTVRAATTSNLASAAAFGGWTTDGRNLPAYQFTADLPLKPVDAAGKPYPLDPDPFFILGNYRVTVFPNGSGLYKIFSGERGWTRLNEPMSGVDQNAGRLEITRDGQSKAYELLGFSGTCADGKKTRRQFGCGYARYEMVPDKDIEVVRTLSLAPSEANAMGLPAMAVTVQITNKGRGDCEFTYRESVLSHVTLNSLGTDTIKPGQADNRPVHFTNAIEANAGQSFVASRATAHADDPGVMTKPADPNRYNLYPAALVLTYPKGVGQNKLSAADMSSRNLDPGAAHLDATVRGKLRGGESRTLVFVIGLSPNGNPADILEFADNLGDAADGAYFTKDWQSALTKFIALQDPVFRRELTWNSHALLAMATYNSFYGETFIPQGMTYDYQMDLTACPRDHLQHSMAAAYFRPSLAKSTIRYVLNKMTDQGEIKYTDFGFGMTSNSAWNTSDQQLYLFQGVGEYLRITGDYAFLNEETTFLPHQAGMKASLLEKLNRAMTYLREEVSTGPHGLVRLMNSDWSDMAFADHSVMRSWGTAESHMNSAMVMAVMPTLSQQIEAYAKTASGDNAVLAKNLITSINLYTDKISKAFYADLGDRTFSRRLYFDPKTPFGDDNMHVEPQSFLLQAASFPVERKKVLWDEVQKRILEGEVVGPRQRQVPVQGGLIEPYVSENGGFWFSLGGQMVTGVATFDKPAALSLLKMMTFDNFAKHYPTYWTGHWSGPDTINSAKAGSIAGLPRPDNDGFWCSFASYCAHAHAWPIYNWSRIAEAQA